MIQIMLIHAASRLWKINDRNVVETFDLGIDI